MGKDFSNLPFEELMNQNRRLRLIIKILILFFLALILVLFLFKKNVIPFSFKLNGEDVIVINMGEGKYKDDGYPYTYQVLHVDYLNRFADAYKTKKRGKEKAEAYKDVEGYLRIEDVMAMVNLKYNQVYNAINKGELNAINIRHKFFISPKDAEAYKLEIDSRQTTIGDNISAFEVAKRFKLNYSYVLRRIRNGVIPFERVDGHFYVSPKDAEEYFGKTVRIATEAQ
jgi:hypothetical protein